MTVHAPSRTAYSQEEVWFPCALDVMGWEENFHELMLHDSLRMTVYEAAVKRAIRPGDVVLDLGTGTGILARWALEAAAERVYGIEVNSRILSIAQRNLREEGFSNRFIPVNAFSFEAKLPEPVDIIISETIGNFGDNEDCHNILADARTRFLRSGGRMLPERLTTFLVPVSSPKAHTQIEQGKCKAVSETYDLRKLLDRLGIEDPFGIYYDVVIPKSCYLAAPRAARVFDFTVGDSQPTYQIQLKFPVTRDGLLTGFKGYFQAQLTEGVVLDISGADIIQRTASDSWKHCYLPLPRPLAVKRGETIAFTLDRLAEENKASPFSFRYQWNADTGKNAVSRRLAAIAEPGSGPAAGAREPGSRSHSGFR